MDNPLHELALVLGIVSLAAALVLTAGGYHGQAIVLAILGYALIISACRADDPRR